jgi:catechol 2,3-dioxygenase-like lactoylglutathione lyase family enzyme
MSQSPGLGPIAQIARTVRDIEEAQRWYQEVLELRHLYTFGKLAFFDCGGTRLYLTEEPVSSASESILYFRVNDIEQWHERLRQRGVEFVDPHPRMIHRHPDGTQEWLAIFKDPEGRMLALMSQVRPQPAACG